MGDIEGRIFELVRICAVNQSSLRKSTNLFSGSNRTLFGGIRRRTAPPPPPAKIGPSKSQIPPVNEFLGTLQTFCGKARDGEHFFKNFLQNRRY